MKRFSAFILACTLAAVAGCSMQDAPERGQKCPPVDAPGTMDCIMREDAIKCITSADGEYSEAFSTQFCPKEFPHCVLDSAKEDSTYYCMKPCDEGKVSCYGNCVNPQTDNTYCGVDERCMGGESCTLPLTCQGGKCLGNDTCEDDAVRCISDDNTIKREQCHSNHWDFLEDCDGMSCREDKTCGVCRDGEEKCEDGVFKKCEKGDWVETPCKDVKGNSASCDADGKKCGVCNNGDVKCENDKTYICADGAWGEETSCKGEEDKATSCKIDKVSCGECKNGEVKCENGVVFTCSDGVWPEEGEACKDKDDDEKPTSCKADGKTCGVCYSSSVKCENGKSYQCNNGVWGDETQCKNENDEPTSCQDKEKCGGCTNDSIICNNGKSYKCLNGKWDEGTACVNSTVCKDVTACGDCIPGEKSCINGKVKICQDNGTWGSETICGTASCNTSGNECAECMPNTTTCTSDKKLKKCGSNGTWESEKSCGGNNYSCWNSQLCCSPGDTRCDNNTKKVYTCLSDGSWDSGKACSVGVCQTDKECGVCKPNEKSCNDGKTKTCNSKGQWGSESNCSNSNVCKNSTTCGDCIPNQNTCSGNKAMTCSNNGVLTTTTCNIKNNAPTPISQTCQNGKCCFPDGTIFGGGPGWSITVSDSSINYQTFKSSHCCSGYAYSYSSPGGGSYICTKNGNICKEKCGSDNCTCNNNAGCSCIMLF